MKVGVCSLVFALAIALSYSAWTQEKDAPKDGAKPAAKEEKKDGPPVLEISEQ